MEPVINNNSRKSMCQSTKSSVFSSFGEIDTIVLQEKYYEPYNFNHHSRIPCFYLPTLIVLCAGTIAFPVETSLERQRRYRGAERRKTADSDSCL